MFICWLLDNLRVSHMIKPDAPWTHTRIVYAILFDKTGKEKFAYFGRYY